MSNEACCKNLFPGSAYQYKEKGHVHEVEDFRVYEVGNGSKYTIAIIDIFGFDVAATKAFCDTLAEKAGLHILMPDYFRKKPWPMEKFPPSDGSELMKWVMEAGSWAKVVRPTTLKTIQWAEDKFGKSSTKWAIFGFCFGGKMTMISLADEGLPFCAGVSLHGGMISADDIAKLRSPVSLHAASDDDPVGVFEEAAHKRGDAIGSASEFFTYADQKHGFCAARADYTNEANVKALQHVFERAAAFLTKNVH